LISIYVFLSERICGESQGQTFMNRILRSHLPRYIKR